MWILGLKGLRDVKPDHPLPYSTLYIVGTKNLYPIPDAN